MNDFSQNQKRQIRETSLKLKEIIGHPAYPFLLKTFKEIVLRSGIANNDSEDSDCVVDVAVCYDKRSYTINLLTAFNHRIDNIIQDTMI